MQGKEETKEAGQIDKRLGRLEQELNSILDRGLCVQPSTCVFLEKIIDDLVEEVTDLDRKLKIMWFGMAALAVLVSVCIVVLV